MSSRAVGPPCSFGEEVRLDSQFLDLVLWILASSLKKRAAPPPLRCLFLP